MSVSLNVNGLDHEVDVVPGTPLVYVLRNDLGLTAAKVGCALEQCGSCTVLVDGVATASCVAPVEAFAGRRITTLEGIGRPEALHPLQQAFLDEQAAQCGYCIPGILVAAVALLESRPRPTDDEIRGALDGHLCRCGSHPRILRAVRLVAETV